MALVHFLDINNWYYKEADYERQKETLLIVDDSKFQRTVLKEMFHDTFELIEVTSGEECLELMENNYNDIDMVLLAPLSAEAVTRRARALGAAI